MDGVEAILLFIVLVELVAIVELVLLEDLASKEEDDTCAIDELLSAVLDEFFILDELIALFELVLLEEVTRDEEDERLGALLEELFGAEVAREELMPGPGKRMLEELLITEDASDDEASDALLTGVLLDDATGPVELTAETDEVVETAEDVANTPDELLTAT